MLFHNQIGKLQEDLTKQKGIAETVSKENQDMRKQIEQIQPILQFVDSFKDPEQLQHFLDLWKKTDAASFPEQGTFYKLELPDKLKAKLEEYIGKTNESPAKALDRALKIGLESMESEYTLLCGKKVKLTKEEMERFNDPLTPIMDTCVLKCPDENINGDVNHCPVFLKADDEEYADDPTYQDSVKSHPNKERVRPGVSKNHSKE